MEKLQRQYREFLCTPHPVFPITDILYYYGTFVTISKSIFIYYYLYLFLSVFPNLFAVLFSIIFDSKRSTCVLIIQKDGLNQ